jgi:fucose 4-O-acetylase-like acetyltransferase
MRNKAIDIEKGIGIILVVLGHNWVIGQKSEELFRIIYSFHVPLFFFLAGVLFRSNVSFLELIAQKWHSILKPYFVVMLGVAINVAISGENFPFENLAGILFGTGQSVLWVHMWFLPHMFISVIFSWSLISFLKLKERIALAYLIIFILLITGVLIMNMFRTLNLGTLSLSSNRSATLVGLPFSVDLLFVSSSYFIFGNIFSDFVKTFKINIYLIILSLTLFIISHYLFDETMNWNSRIYGDLVLSTLQAICGIYLIIVIAETIKHINTIERLLSYIGSGSLFVLIFHSVLQGKAISKYQMIFPNSGLIGGLFGLIAGIACSLILWEVSKRIPIASAFLLPQRSEVLAKT